MERLTMHTPDNFGYAEYQLKPGVDEQDAVSRLAAYEDTGLSPADIPALTARAEAAEAERDRAIKQMCRFCKSLDKKAGIKPVCAADCEWRGQQAGKGGAE